MSLQILFSIVGAPSQPQVNASARHAMIGNTLSIVINISWTDSSSNETNSSTQTSHYRVRIGDHLLVVQNTTAQVVMPSSGEVPDVSVTAIDKCNQASKAGIAAVRSLPMEVPTGRG